MANFSLPVNATSTIDYLVWTNQVTSEWGMGIFMLFFTFILPFLYLNGVGKDKIEVLMISSLVSATLMFIVSLGGIVPSLLVISMFLLTGISMVIKYFADR